MKYSVLFGKTTFCSYFNLFVNKRKLFIQFLEERYHRFCEAVSTSLLVNNHSSYENRPSKESFHVLSDTSLVFFSNSTLREIFFYKFQVASFVVVLENLRLV